MWLVLYFRILSCILSTFEESKSVLLLCDLTGAVPRSGEEFFQRHQVETPWQMIGGGLPRWHMGLASRSPLNLVVQDMLEMTGITWVNLESQKALALSEKT